MVPGTQHTLSVDNFIIFVTVELLKLTDLGFKTNKQTNKKHLKGAIKKEVSKFF